MDDREQSPGEEFANSLSHGLALLVALVAVPYLLLNATLSSGMAFTGIVVFATTMLLLYLVSTLYHALPPGRAKRVLLRLDYGAIFLFIAGSYTPFALGAPAAAHDGSLLALVWLVAGAGFALKAGGYLSHPRVSTGLYLAMGWLVLVAALPLIVQLPRPGVQWLLAGGLAYSVGVIFFVLDARIRYAHSVWHGFVTAGTGCHFLAVLSLAG